MSTISEILARFTESISLDNVPTRVVESASIYLADTLACAVAAAADPDAATIEIVVEQAAKDRGSAEATVFGTGWKSSVRAASLANCTMARYLDANDIYMPESGDLAGSGHFSDAIPALVAAAEAYGASGPELIESITVAYEVQASLADSLPWLDRGFHSVSQVAPAAALGAGCLMGLTPIQLAHAASLAITTGSIVQTWLHPSDEVPAIKGGASGLAAERGITCAELAGRGFTGPLDAFETFFEYFSESDQDRRQFFERLGEDWRTPRNAIKPAPAQIYIQPVAQCALSLFRQGLRSVSLKRLTVRSNDGACGRVQGSAGAYRPTSREAADHSTPFVVAMALRDGQVGPATYRGTPWLEAAVLDAMSRVDLIIDDCWGSKLARSGQFGAELEAEDVDGHRYFARTEQFRGHPDNPLSRDELVAKLEAFVEPDEVLGPGAGSKLLDGCLALAEGGSVAMLLDHCRLSGRSANRA